MSLLLFLVLANGLLLFALHRKLRGARALFLGLCVGLPLCSVALYGVLGQGWLAEHAAEKQSRLFAEQAEQFASLSPKERAARIRAMVESLSERLQAEGGSPETWLRLARARSVLGEKAATRAVLKQGERAHPSAAEQPSWIAISISLLLTPPFAEEDKAEIQSLFARWHRVVPEEDSLRKDLEHRLAPLLQ